jgi:hypothetical protein
MVTTLPITPTLGGRFQTVLSIFVASQYASFTGDCGFLALNLVGERLKDLNEVEKIKLGNDYQNCCQHFEQSKLELWADNDPNYADYVLQSIKKLRREGLLYEALVPVLLCPCGAVEILAEAPLLPVGAKTYKLVHPGVPICRLCAGFAEKKNREALLLKSLYNPGRAVAVYPSWARSEARELENIFFNTNILVSRSKRDSSPLVDRQSGLAIDSDFFWSMFAAYLAEKNSDKSIILITSNRSLRQALRVGQIATTLNAEQSVSVIVNPTFRFQGGSREAVSVSVEDFCASAKPEVLRYLLSLSLQWGSKETIVETSRLYWIRHSIYPENIFTQGVGDISISTPEEFLRICNKAMTEKLISKLRKKHPLDIYEKLLWKNLS